MLLRETGQAPSSDTGPRATAPPHLDEQKADEQDDGPLPVRPWQDTPAVDFVPMQYCSGCKRTLPLSDFPSKDNIILRTCVRCMRSTSPEAANGSTCHVVPIRFRYEASSSVTVDVLAARIPVLLIIIIMVNPLILTLCVHTGAHEKIHHVLFLACLEVSQPNIMPSKL
ncbi:hypothetical protein E4U31_005797 [Claviceps sp. LM219 group G6]|nr:hypothetical protein E4U31_005797 [Claviceps sp. LM219 group G6]